MSLNSEPKQLEDELKKRVSDGFRKILLYFGLLIVFATFLLPLMKLAEDFSGSRVIIMIGIAFVFFGGSGFIFYRLISVYRRSIICPRCVYPYNIGPLGNVPFARKCQHCGLEMSQKDPPPSK